MAENPNHGALSGLTVLDLSRLLPGPFCSMILADHGARVIMIEDRRFESESGFPELPMRNKEHMCLNLKSEQGKAVFFKMVKTADVVLEGFRPGVVKKLGVDYESIKKINPGIIYCAITGYGQTGPLKDRPGHDVNYLGESGLLSLIGEADSPPSIPGFQVADLAGGGMNAVIGILLALHARNRNGQGQYIDISMTDGCASLLTLALDFRQMSGQPITRSDSILSHRFAFYNTYETKDHKYLSLGCLEFRFWKKLCECLNKDEWIGLQFDENRKDDLINDMRTLFRSKNLDEWEKTFEGKDICWGIVKSLDEALSHPLLIERDMIVDHDREGGVKKKTLGIPVKLSQTPGSIRRSPASFGKDTESILGELGYSQTDIRAFIQQGIV
ncbi:MAG: CoA transferase [Proteobacteria bacterium]|nr:CoA transferase [Pseudomonadota bacterium]